MTHFLPFKSKNFKSEIKKLQTLLVNIILLIKNFTKQIENTKLKIKLL